MSETKNAPPRVGRWYRVGGTVMQYSVPCSIQDSEGWLIAGHMFDAADGAEVRIPQASWRDAEGVEQLGTTGQRFAALEERIAALEARPVSHPVTLNVRPGGFITRRDVYGDAKPSLAPPQTVDRESEAHGVYKLACEERDEARSLLASLVDAWLRRYEDRPAALSAAREFLERPTLFYKWPAQQPSLAPPAGAWTPSPESVAVFPGGCVPPSDVSDETRARLAACHVDHDACGAEQRGSAGRAAQGPCVRGVVDLVTPSADDQHAAERGTSSAGAEVTASDGGDTARADSAIAERRRWASAIAAALGDCACAGRSLEELAARIVDVRAELERERALRRAAEDALAAKSDPRNEEARKRGLTVGARVRAWGERGIAKIVGWDEDGDPVLSWDALADASGSAVVRVYAMAAEKVLARIVDVRAELERERALRRAAEDALAAKSDPRNDEARKRGLTVGARVRAHDHAGRTVAHGRIVGWDSEGDPEVEHMVAGRARTDAYYADLVERDTEAAT